MSETTWKPGFPTEPGDWWFASEDIDPFVTHVYLGDDGKLHCDIVMFIGQPLEDQLEAYPTIEHAPATPPP